MSAVPTITESPGASPAASTTAPPEPPRPTWTICDGCNNSFLVWPNRFLYKPITPIESSSGFYSGGEPCDIPLTPAQFAEIDAALAVFLAPDHPHIAPERHMGVSILEHQHLGQRQRQLLQSEAKVTAVLDRLRPSAAVPAEEKKKGFFEKLLGSK